MNDGGASRQLADVTLLIFSAGGVSFAVDADQMAGTSVMAGEPDEGIPRLLTLMGCKERLRDGKGATMLVLKSDNPAPFRVAVDVLEDMVEISAAQITPFPFLVEPFALQRGMWGVIEWNGKLVLLLDFLRLSRNTGHETVHNGGG